jgi:hypothetical protein
MKSFPYFESRTKKYVKSLSKISILSAALFALVMSMKIGLLHGIIAGIVFSIVITMLIALIFIPIDYMCTAKLPLEALNVNQERDIKLKGNCDPICTYCAEIVKNTKGVFKIDVSNKCNIVAFTKTTISSFGEVITLHLSQIDQETTNIHIVSQPKYKYTIIDYGKNYKNVEYIINQIAHQNIDPIN